MLELHHGRIWLVPLGENIKTANSEQYGLTVCHNNHGICHWGSASSGSSCSMKSTNTFVHVRFWCVDATGRSASAEFRMCIRKWREKQSLTSALTIA